MSDHCEEQEMEAEALAAIFDTSFEVISSSQPFEWSVKLVPVDCGGDEEEEEKQNHVAVKLISKIPLDYPEESLPELDIEVIKGLALEQKQDILALANDEAEANAGMPAIFAVCEAVRTWLADNNVKGLDDGSMHAQMMRRAKEAERSKAKAEQKFEAQKEEEEMTQAELEELAVRKRRAEGTPCTEENFNAWKEKFDKEMAQKKIDDDEQAQKEVSGKKKSVEKKDDTADRLTGFDQFSGKAGIMNLEAMEAAAEEIENGSDDESDDVKVEDLDVDEELFDDDDDLDDLDFDDSDDDDEEEEPDI